jgi:hypothetical protein
MKALFREGVKNPCETCPLRNEGIGICEVCPELQEYLEIKAHDEVLIVEG